MILLFKNFFKSGASGGIILIAAVAVSLFIANSFLENSFADLLAYKIGFTGNSIDFRYSILSWVNDGLMAIFFLLIGLEIKREVINGELSSFQKASLPVIAAVGGAIVPALLFYAFNKGSVSANGWGIPMATDIAFALAILSLVGNRAPASLKIFLAALAIADDLIAIIIIAVFYSTELKTNYLLYSAILFIVMMAFNKMKIRSLWFYLIPGILLWYFIHHSGVHATIAGVLTALAIPHDTKSADSPLEHLEHTLLKPVNFIIMPLFALVNTNISFHYASKDIFSGEAFIGILAGLVIGKPVGIFIASWLSVKLGWSSLPDKTKWGHIAGIGMLGGIGFTMSIFIALLSFSDQQLQLSSKFSILIASTFSGIVGFIVLRMMSSSSIELKKH